MLKKGSGVARDENGVRGNDKRRWKLSEPGDPIRDVRDAIT